MTAVNSAAELSTDGSQLVLTVKFLKKAYESGDECRIEEMSNTDHVMLITKKRIKTGEGRREWKTYIGRYDNKSAATSSENNRTNPIRTYERLNDTAQTKLTTFLQRCYYSFVHLARHTSATCSTGQ